MSAQDVAARIRLGLVNATSRLSADGQPLTGEIVRVSGGSESVYPPTPGTDKTYTFVCGLGDATEEDFQGTEITARDVRVIVSRPVVAEDGEEIEPKNDDKLFVNGIEYSVVSVRSTMFGGFPVMWSCQCRRSG